MSKSLELINKIKEMNGKDDNSANEFFQNNKDFIYKHYKDNDGTFIHHIIYAMIKKCESLSFVFSHSSDGRDFVKEIAEVEFKSYLDLLSSLLRAGFPYHVLNKKMFLPIELFKNRQKEKADKNDVDEKRRDMIFNVLASLVKDKFEKCSEYIYEGKKYVLDLTLYRSSKMPRKECLIPDCWEMINRKDGVALTLHQRLAMFKKYLEKNNLYAGADNLVVANIGFIISDAGKTKRIFITLPVSDPAYILIGDKGGGHSEINLIDYLNEGKASEKIIEGLEKEIKERELDNGVSRNKIYAVVLDIHSTKEICGNCTTALNNFQKNSKFILDLQKKLKDKFNLPKRDIDRFHVLKEFNNKTPNLTTVEIGTDNNSNKRRIVSDTDSGEKKIKSNVDEIVLPLIIRSSGLNDHGRYDKAMYDKDYCFPLIRKSYSRDIKTHAQGVLFHLPPAEIPFTKLGHGEKKELESMYTARISKNPKIESALKVGFFSINIQTAFANSSVKAKNVTRSAENTQLKTEEIKEFKQIEDLQILSHSLRV